MLKQDEMKKKLKNFLLAIYFLIVCSIILTSYTLAQSLNSVTVFLHGIGSGGDNKNISSQGTTNPQTPSRNLTIDFFNASQNLVASQNITVTYNGNIGNYLGKWDPAKLPPGSYSIKMSIPGYLSRILPNSITIEQANQYDLPAVWLITGDVTYDNKLNISDYNQIIDCFSDTLPPRNCADTTKKKRSDITDDNKVDQADYNLFLREFLTYYGDGEQIGSPTPTNITASPTHTMNNQNGESMAMMAWRVGGKNSPNTLYDKCDDGTDIVRAHSSYYVVAYDGLKYPTWHPPVVINPVTGSGKCYFGHEHGSNPQKYIYWNDIVQFFGKDTNGDGKITPLVIGSNGEITEGDRAGLPFGIANEHMEQYYNKEERDSIFVRHEDHVGHKIEFVNSESDMIGHSTHTMTQPSGTVGINVPYYKGNDSNTYYPTGVLCTHLHKFHQGTHSADAIQNNLHEVIFHSTCTSTRSEYPGNTLLLTGMMTFGNPGGYKRFCGNDRDLLVCVQGKNTDGSCKVNDPLLAKLPASVYSDTLGRNMVDRSCLENIDQITGSKYFTPYELWQGDLRITTPTGKMLAEHGRQWDVLDPVRFVDPTSTNGISYNAQQCGSGGLLFNRTLLCDATAAWDSPKSNFRGLKRTAYFGRNRISNNGGSQIMWTDPLGGNATQTMFSSGLKQKFSTVEADICSLPECSKLNDRALQRQFDDGQGTVHAPN